jgi:hypothetical protein
VSTFRRRVELRAGPLVVLAGQAPRALVFGGALLLLVGGLLAGGVLGGVLLLALAAALGLLLLMSWPALIPQARALRSGVVALLVVRALLFLF